MSVKLSRCDKGSRGSWAIGQFFDSFLFSPFFFALVSVLSTALSLSFQDNASAQSNFENLQDPIIGSSEAGLVLFDRAFSYRRLACLAYVARSKKSFLGSPCCLLGRVH